MLPIMPNPLSSVLKKHIFEMIKGKYQNNEKFVDRVTALMVTREDFDSLATLVSDIYEAGFMRAVNQYKEQLAKVGMKVEIVPEEGKKPSQKIFKD